MVAAHKPSQPFTVFAFGKFCYKPNLNFSCCLSKVSTSCPIQSGHGEQTATHHPAAVFTYHKSIIMSCESSEFEQQVFVCF